MHTGPYLDHEIAQHISEMRRDRAAIGFMLDSRVRSGSRFNVRPVMRYFARLLRWNRPVPTVEPRATGELERIVTPC